MGKEGGLFNGFEISAGSRCYVGRGTSQTRMNVGRAEWVSLSRSSRESLLSGLARWVRCRCIRHRWLYVYIYFIRAYSGTSRWLWACMYGCRGGEEAVGIMAMGKMASQRVDALLPAPGSRKP